MYHKKGQRAAAFLGLLLTLTLCLGTLVQGFAFAETTSDTQATQTENPTAGTSEGADSTTVAEEPATDNDGETNTEDTGKVAEEPQTVSAYATSALFINGNGATSKSSTLYSKTATTSEVGITVTYDSSKDSQMTGYEVTKYSLWDVTNTDTPKQIIVENVKDFNIDDKVTFKLENGHKYEARATATKDVNSTVANSESADAADAIDVTESDEQAATANVATLEDEATKSGENGEMEIVSNSTYSLKVPGEVSNFYAKCDTKKDNLIKVYWDDVDGADAYYVYRNTKNSRPSTPITKVKKSYYEQRKQGGSYYYWVLPVNETYQTVGTVTSASNKVTAGNYLTCAVRNYWFTATTKKKVPIYSSASSKKVVGYLKKGTTFKILKKSPKTVAQYGKVKRVYFNENGKKGWVTYSSIKKKDHISGKNNDWSPTVKEAYVNGKNSTGKMFTSSTKYLIWLSKYTQKVNVFKKSNGKWKLIHTYRCSTGTFVHPTPTNLNYIVIRKQSVRHRVTNTGLQYYYKYLSAFGKKGSSGKGNAFHTICWNTLTNKPQKKVNDRPNTKGCARMFTSSAYWIYKNVPNKTRVVSY